MKKQTMNKKAKKVVLSDKEKSDIRLAAHATWSVIGYDAMKLVSENGEKLTVGVIVEFVLDAGRISSHLDPKTYAKFLKLSFKDQDKIVREAFIQK